MNSTQTMTTPLQRLFSKTFVLFLLLGVAFSNQARAVDYELTCKTIPDLFRAYLTQHIVHKSLTPELQVRTMEQYVKLTDPTKMLFLEEDIGAVKKNIQKLFLGMRKNGDCSPLDDIQKLIVKRVKENEATVKKLITEKEFKIDENIELVLNPDKRHNPKTLSEKEELIRKSLNFQMWNYLSSDTKKDEAKEKLIHRYELATKRVVERSQVDLLVSFIDAFTNALDPHTSYFSKDRLDDFRIDMSLSLEGIGASLSSSDGYTIVEDIIPGGAADRAKVLVPKDKIIAVGQGEKGPTQSVMDMDLKDVVRLIRGKKGSKVRLSLLRKEGETTKRQEVIIVRDKINLEDQAAKISYHEHKLPNGKNLNLAVIDLPSFYGDQSGDRSGYVDMKKLLAEANAKNVDGLILNLARNGGGLLEDAVRISGLFIKEGAIVATLNSRKDVNILRDKDPTIQFDKPLIVLTSRASASASEILAGALRDYNRALVVGADNTFGKGSVQAVLDLPANLGAMKVTTGMFFVPGGNSTQNLGVAGHVVLPSTLSTDDLGEKNLDNALPPLKISPFKSKDIGDNQWKPITTSLAKQLQKLSTERVSKNDKFIEIEKDITEMNKNDGIVKLAEMIKKEKEEKAKKKKDEDEKSFKERVADLQKPYIDESLNILADLIEKQYPKAGAIILGDKAPNGTLPKN